MKLLAFIFSFLATLSINAQSSEDLQFVYDHLYSNASQWGLSEIDLSAVIVTDYHQSQQSGIKNFYLRQSIDQIEVFNANANVHIKDDQIIAMHQNFIAGIFENHNLKTPLVEPETAVRNVAQHLGQESTFDLGVKEIKNQNNRERSYFAGDYAYEDIKCKLSYYPKKNQLFLSWEIAINDVVTNKWWQVFVDASNGEILDKVSWTTECIFDIPSDRPAKNSNTKHTDCRHNEDIVRTRPEKSTSEKVVMTNSYNVFAVPFLSPLDGGRTVESAPWNNALNASPHGWHDTNNSPGAEYTITRGNNVHAQEDRNGNNGTGNSPDGGAGLDFDFDFDEHDTPINYTDFATTNLFYWNNIAHDVWYQYGFDEASGNFQFNNYGKGGSGSDEVMADSQDGSGTNNANFSTPPDGSNPRMQMFEWSAESFNVFSVNNPAAIARNYGVSGANFGPQDAVVSGNVVQADPVLACSALTNGGAINGNIALIDRGSCSFSVKVKNAQNAGAIAVIVCNNVAGPPSNMGGSDGTITIPSVMLSKMNCDTLKNYLPGVNVTIDVNSAVTKDSDLENGVILHEYGHGISIRLTGGPSTSSCLNNSEQMGEGWSDWFGVVTTMQEGDIGADTRGMGSYLKGEPLNDNGIRTYPYTTDISINQHTYDDIKTASIPHGVGSVWCEMLWEMTWALIEEHGFDSDIYSGTGGNNIAMQLVIEGLKLQPCNPGFVDGRDAILLADVNLYGGANQCIIWEAFAKRGLGFSATQGSSASRSDGTEAFDMPDICSIGFSFSKVADQFVESGTDLTYSFSMINNDTVDQTNIVILDTLPLNVTVQNGTMDCGGTVTGNVVELTRPILMAGASGACEFDIVTDMIPNSSLDFFDGVESGTSNWTVSSDQGTGVFLTSSGNPHIGTFSWFVPNVPADNSQFLTSNTLSLGNVPVLAFSHDYDTELGWDGGMVELSTDGGSNWTDLGDKIFFNGYNGTLGSSSNSDIAGRLAFTGDSNGYITSYINLENWANQNVLIRFFFGSDDNTVETGWYIDQIILYEANFIINSACVTTNEGYYECDEVTTLVVKECDVPFVVYQDNDGDGFGNPNSTLLVCSVPTGYVMDNTDCDDEEPTNFPGNTEICGDGIDNNCNNIIDEGCMMFECDGDTLYISSITQDNFHAADYISSDVSIAPGLSVVYTAGIDIDLLDGFEVESGADFHAYIQSCSVLMRMRGELDENRLLKEDDNWQDLFEYLQSKPSELVIYDASNNEKAVMEFGENSTIDIPMVERTLENLGEGLFLIKASNGTDQLLMRYLNF